jgi:hypothetical protein
MSNVTPRPWAIHDNGSYLDIGVPSGETRFPVYPTVMIGVDYGNKANADHIVKCVNYHERLVGHLDRLCAHADCGDVPPWIEEWNEVRALLAELDKEPAQ